MERAPRGRDAYNKPYYKDTWKVYLMQIRKSSAIEKMKSEKLKCRLEIERGGCYNVGGV